MSQTYGCYYSYGCKRDSFDHRDHQKVYEYVPSCQSHPKVDLRQYVGGIYDQGKLGSCTANALCAAYKFDMKKELAASTCTPSVSFPLPPVPSGAPRFPNSGLPTYTGPTYLQQQYVASFNRSRLFLYYNSRKMENNIYVDSGCSIRDAVKAFARDGVCAEQSWPYKIDMFMEQPNPFCYQEAKGNVISKYERLVHQDIHQFRACLKEECPFVFGFVVYESFYSSANMHYGKMPMPTTNDEIKGRHAVMAVGYDDTAKHFIILNSWGIKFGDKGYFYMPYDFIVDPHKAFDFWKITYSTTASRP